MPWFGLSQDIGDQSHIWTLMLIQNSLFRLFQFLHAFESRDKSSLWRKGRHIQTNWTAEPDTDSQSWRWLVTTLYFFISRLKSTKGLPEILCYWMACHYSMLWRIAHRKNIHNSNTLWRKPLSCPLTWQKQNVIKTQKQRTTVNHSMVFIHNRIHSVTRSLPVILFSKFIFLMWQLLRSCFLFNKKCTN